jgi:hypothetical protein
MKSILMILITFTAVVSEAKPAAKAADPKKKIVYLENQTLDFEGLSLDGELKAPGEFYFQNRNQERFDSLTKRRVHFRREMLRDSVQSN